MNSRWDYILYEDKHERVMFRLYPRHTYIHSFDDNPPTKWEEVYKVYYSWAIIKTYKDDDGKLEPESADRVFDMEWDECSNVVNLHAFIWWVIESQETFNYPTVGQPAADWIITPRDYYEEWENKYYEYYNFQVFDNCRNTGFRFRLDRKQTEDFANWLEEMNNRALVRCGCPI